MKKLSSFHLKMIAVVSMFIDHFAAVFFTDMINASYVLNDTILNSTRWIDRVLCYISQHQQTMWNLYDSMRIIGRLAFPIYCFLLVQGFLHTRSRKKYALRLFLFCLISEVPFDLAFSKSFFEPGYNNVFITLFLGFLMIWGMEEVERRFQTNRIVCGALSAGTVILACQLAFTLNTDYGMAGILVILCAYVFSNHLVFAQFSSVIVLIVMTMGGISIYALPTVLLVAMYNGEKGCSMKYIFYCFYPLHLILLVGAVWAMGWR